MTPETILMLDVAMRAHRRWREMAAITQPPPALLQAAPAQQTRSIGHGASLGATPTPTPAQAAGHPDFVTDVPVQGPTDEGMRAASCWWAQNRLPPKPPCVDCSGGPIPMWTQRSLCPGGQQNGSGLVGVGESISFGGARRVGFALEGSGDPDLFSTLTPAQQAWVLGALTAINAKIVLTGSSCPTWVDPGVNLRAAVGCFQIWYNANYVAQVPGHTGLRTDGGLDAATVCALVWLTTVGPLSADFPVKFPQDPSSVWANQCAVQTADPGSMPNPPVPPAVPTPTPVPAPTPTPTPPAPTPVPATASHGMSTGAKVAVGAVGAVVVAGIVYAATR